MHQRRALKKKQIRLSRIRYKLKKRANGRLRLSVFLSGRHTYAQVIDDTVGNTLALVSTLRADDVHKVSKSLKNTQAIQKRPKSLPGSNKSAAHELGKACGQKLVDLGCTKIFLDRGNKVYHGRLAAFAEGVREMGIEF